MYRQNRKKENTKRLRHSGLGHFIVPVALTFIAFTVIGFLVLIPSFEEDLIDQKRLLIRELVNTSWNILEGYHLRAESGEFSREEAQERAVRHIRRLRYGPENKDYFWINDIRPAMIMHPYRKELEGTDLSNFTDPNGVRPFVEFTNVARARGGGYVDYMWQWKDEDTLIVPKISYVRLFEPWGWVIGTGLYVEDARREVNAITDRLAYATGGILVVIVFLSGYVIRRGYVIESARQRTLRELQESRKFMDSILKNVPDIVYRLDPEGRIVFVNDAVKYYGFNPDELTGKQFLDLVHPDDRKKAEFRINERRSGDRRTKTLEVRLLTKKNEPVPFEVNSNGMTEDQVFQIDAEGIYVRTHDDDKKFIGTQGVARDVTGRKRIEKALRESEQKYRSVVEMAQDGIIIIQDEKLVYLNSGFAEMTGRSMSELTGTSFKKYFSADTVEQVSGNYTRRITGGVVDSRYEAAIVRNDGKRIDVEITAQKLNYRGRPAVLGIVRDITDRKRMIEALRESEERFRSYIENANDIVYTLDENGIFTYVSPSWKDILGHEIEEVVGHDFTPFVHEEDVEQCRTFLKKIYTTGEKGTIEYRTLHKDGSIHWHVTNAALIPRGSGEPPHYIGIAREVTEQKQLESQFFHAQKMESIGRLAGGIAHDFNNILTSIMGYAELLKIKFGKVDTPEGEAADIILRGAERSSKLTRQLLGFARKGKYNPVRLNIHKAIMETVRVSEKIFEKRIRVKYAFDEDISLVKADENQIDQVFTNLIINAKDAMPTGGEITISTRNIVIDRDYSQRFPELKPGDYVRVSVSDTGIGIPEHVRENIFDPFFTTKGEGKGTGLGLATVYGIVKNHGGYINVYSEVGKGTTFNLYFPATNGVQHDTVSEHALVKGKANILIVDDEDDLRKLLKEMLQHLGYTVRDVSCGADAVDIHKRNPNQTDLVLLDMIMPEMSGSETFRGLKAIDPDVKVVFLSGYDRNAVQESELPEGADGFLQKPFHLHEVSELIHSVLSDTREAEPQQ